MKKALTPILAATLSLASLHSAHSAQETVPTIDFSMSTHSKERTTQSDAASYCEGLGRRLPTIAESREILTATLDQQKNSSINNYGRDWAGGFWTSEIRWGLNSINLGTFGALYPSRCSVYFEVTSAPAMGKKIQACNKSPKYYDTVFVCVK